jgi:hypothetical protein
VAGAAAVLRARIATARAAARTPILVALDGRSGAGKSTLAQQVGAAVAALVIDGDDFYRGGGDAFWDARGAGEKVDLVIDWRRQRALLRQLALGEAVTWRPYDWDADDGRLGPAITAGPAGVVLLDRAYSARPQLGRPPGPAGAPRRPAPEATGAPPLARGGAVPEGVGGPVG